MDKDGHLGLKINNCEWVNKSECWLSQSSSRNVSSNRSSEENSNLFGLLIFNVEFDKKYLDLQKYECKVKFQKMEFSESQGVISENNSSMSRSENELHMDSDFLKTEQEENLPLPHKGLHKNCTLDINLPLDNHIKVNEPRRRTFCQK